MRLRDQELKRQLGEFEARYGITSEGFLRRYTSGELGDDLTFIRWSGLLRIASKTALFELAALFTGGGGQPTDDAAFNPRCRSIQRDR